jgi:hypothetical protein
MSLSNTFETTTLQWLFTTTSVTRPTAWYLALYTVAPTDSTSGTEVSGGSYARQSVSLSVSGDTATNGSAVEWPEATGSWGTVVAAAVVDSLSGGNIIAYGALTTNKSISSGDVFRFAAGALDVTLN